jgi:rod shape-determining protein MreD
VNRTVANILVVLGAVILQVGVAPYISIGGVVPNFLLLAAVTLAMVQGPMTGCAAGFACGVLFDLLGSGPVGPMAIVLAATGYIAGLLARNLFAEGWLLPLSVLALASLGAELAYALLLTLLGTPVPFLRAVFTLVIPGAVYNTALALLAYPFLARFLRRERPVAEFRRLA